MECRVIAVILMLASCILSVYSKRSKCSKLISKIPVHKEFDINKFLGAWFTVARTTVVWGENTYESASLVLARNADDSLSYSYTGHHGGMCTAIETGRLEPGRRPGEFMLKGPLSPDPRMIVSFTDYRDVALVYFCYKFRGGRSSICKYDGAQVEVLAKSANPNKALVAAYLDRAAKRLCVSAEDMQSTKPGLCKVPDILEAARKEIVKGDSSEATSEASSGCVVDNIPVQPDVDLSMLNGVWYEIARTRYTFNKLESVVSHMVYDDKRRRTYSFYTGTMASTLESDEPCVTPLKGTTKPKDRHDLPAYRLGKIGGDDSVYPWAPMKILYIDENYIMFFACYTGQTDEPCEHQGSEISIVGRTRDLEESVREQMFALLPDTCIDPVDVLETNFEANCSSYVAGISPQPERKPSDCLLEEIEVYDDYHKTEFAGVWELYARIHYNSSAARSGVVMATVVKEDLREDTESTVLVQNGDFLDGEQLCSMYTTRHRERCMDTANRIMTLPYLDETNFVFSKVLHICDKLLVEYTCAKLSPDGTCEQDGILFNVFRRYNVTDDVIVGEEEQKQIEELAKSVCLDPKDLEYETEWCPVAQLADMMEPTELDSCDVDSLSMYSDLADYNQEDLYGYWRLLAYTNTTVDLGEQQSVVAYFTSDNNDTLTAFHTGTIDETLTAEVSSSYLLARCREVSLGDYLLRTKTTDHLALYAAFKVLYLDEGSVLITYTCKHVLPNGRCNEREAQVRVWGRSGFELDEGDLENARDMMYWACVDTSEEEGFLLEMAPVANDTSIDVLKEYIKEHNIDGDIDDDDNDEDYDEYDDDDKRQKDQGQDDDDDDDDDYDDDWSDLEAELLMDDEDFYGS